MTARKRPTERQRQQAKPRWSQVLKPYAEAYAALTVKLDEDLRAMTTEQIEMLREACSRPTESNCWWATYAVAPIVDDAAEAETWRRATEAKREAEQ